MTLTGYADPLSVKVGETINFMLSDKDPGAAEVALVRLLHGDINPLGPGFVEMEMPSALPPNVHIETQAVTKGAYALPHDPGRRLSGPFYAGTLHAFIQPSLIGDREHVIMGNWDADTRSGCALLITADSYLCLRIADGRKTTELVGTRRLAPNIWYFVSGGWDARTGQLKLWQFGRVNRWNSVIGLASGFELDDVISLRAGFSPSASACPFALAASRMPTGAVTGLYNGKIDRPGIHDELLEDAEIEAISHGSTGPSASLVAYWDTSLGYTDEGIDDILRDIGPYALHAKGVNRPVRGMTGWNWQGRDDSFRLAPEQYGGVVFHDDALIDCEWKPSLTFTVPDDLPSGVYALKVRKGTAEDHVPFFVRPATAQSTVALLMPTFTYLAYANEHLAFEAPIAQAICANTPIVTPLELDWKADELFGLSTYDVHSDGAGVCYSSSRRPILNMRPQYRMPATGVAWAFPADLSLVWWLHAKGYECDIITDHDLHREGHSLLAPYRAVLTGTHPEYHSSRMLDAIEDYISDGGRFLYLGGNGFYWATHARADEPWCIEVRKLDTGSRAWQAAPGEGYLATSGERSGLWRSRGRAPQKLVGVGFTTEGMDESKPFERLPDSNDLRVDWIFEGVGTNELIGDFGLGLGGACGLEMDRYDLALGTPPHTLLLASSFGHSDNYPLVSEDIAYAFPGRGGTQDPQVRGDMVFFVTSTGGAVFAAGSIAWSQALPSNNGDNNVSRILGNVLDGLTRNGELPNFAMWNSRD